MTAVKADYYKKAIPLLLAMLNSFLTTGESLLIKTDYELMIYDVTDIAKR